MRVRLTGPKNAQHLIKILDPFVVVLAHHPHAWVCVIVGNMEVDSRGINIQAVLEQILYNRARLTAGLLHPKTFSA